MTSESIFTVVTLEVCGERSFKYSIFNKVGYYCTENTGKKYSISKRLVAFYCCHYDCGAQSLECLFPVIYLPTSLQKSNGER